jgi:hypothetical protein
MVGFVKIFQPIKAHGTFDWAQNAPAWFILFIGASELLRVIGIIAPCNWYLFLPYLLGSNRFRCHYGIGIRHSRPCEGYTRIHPGYCVLCAINRRHIWSQVRKHTVLILCGEATRSMRTGVSCAAKRATRPFPPVMALTRLTVMASHVQCGAIFYLVALFSGQSAQGEMLRSNAFAA